MAAITSKKKSWWQILSHRRTIQVSALVLSNAGVLTVLRFIPCGYLQCSNCAISTFACPLILIERGAMMISMGLFGAMSAKILGSVAGALAMLILFGAIFGAFACGWFCPFGLVQDMIAKLPVKKFRLPGWSGHLRLPIFLGLVVLLPYLSQKLIFCDLCPPGAINRLWQQALGIPLFFKAPEGMLAVASFMLLATVLAVSVVAQRPFCSLLCPIGGFLGLFNKVSGLFIRVDKDGCVDCKRCRDKCPQGIDPVNDPGHSQCTRCLECTTACRFISADLRL